MLYCRIIILIISIFLSACVSSSNETHRSDINQLRYIPKENISRSEVELADTIREIMALSLVQDKFEKNDEYLKRVGSLFLQYDGRRYELIENCNEVYGRFEHKKLVDYDVENESLILTFPDMDSESMRVDDINTFRELYSSFIQVGESKKNVSEYRANNAFGNEIEVTVLREEGIGVAILSEGIRFYKGISESWSYDSYANSRPKPKQFKVPMSRDKARSALKDCRVVFDVQSVFKDMYPYQMRSILGASNQPMRSILLTQLVDHAKPTMAEPYDIEHMNYKMPVILLGVKILTGDREQLLDYKLY